MSDSDSENITNIMERDSAPPPEKRIKFQVNQNAGRSEIFLRVQKIIIKQINYFTNRYC